MQKQFRPPINKVCIEVPAGLIDEGETPEVCALRELKEETGYVGEVIKDGSAISALMFNGMSILQVDASSSTYPMRSADPGFCNTNLQMVHVKIDMSKPENQNLKPELEENEFIEVFTLPLRDLYAQCRKFEKEGYGIDARVGTLAEGLEVARKWKL